VPKIAEYQIHWSDTRKGYEIVHTPFSFPLKDQDTLYYWLNMVDSFRFCARSGETMTLRKETKARGGGYWYAYKRVGSTVKKKYLGERTKITLALLETTARHFTDPAPQEPSQQPPRQGPPPRKPTLKFEKTLQSALHIYGFSTIPARKELILKYRELSKRHHPDTGGVHEDMVAVNLAYDYLKKFVS
jgi:hypothetical protein